MCGIIGYKGNNIATKYLLSGLKHLEYRGYDSVGMAVFSENEINIKKDIGKVDEVNSRINFETLTGNLGIAHSRWATTGKVSTENSHPHLSSCKSFAIVHNGIVENYQELKKDLIEKGFEFISETDSEVIVKLIELELKNKDFDIAVRSVFSKLKGRNAIVAFNKEDKMIGIKMGSPLVFGFKNNEFFLASDISAFLEYTKDVIFLDDDEGVIIQNNDYNIFDLKSGVELKKEITSINWDIEKAKKGKFDHFMIKEIMEQKKSIKQALAQDKDKILKIANMINNSFGTYAVACGTAGKVCLYGTYVFSEIAKEHINFTFGSEFENYRHFLTKDSLLITISQSGETADALEAIDVAKSVGAKVISIVNVMGSSIMRKSDETLLVNAGPEIAVASTKATTGQMAIMTLLSYACAGKYEEGIKILENICDKIDIMLNEIFLNNIQHISNLIKNSENVYVIGRSSNYPMALEAAIKICEVSYIHAEGFAGGELKHGPIALISKGTPCIVLVGNDDVKEEILTNALEIKSRGALIIGVSPENNEIFDYHIEVPDVGELSGMVNIVPIQLLSYYLAIAKGLNPDKPRNLAKSVTVK